MVRLSRRSPTDEDGSPSRGAINNEAPPLGGAFLLTVLAVGREQTEGQSEPVLSETKEVQLLWTRS